MHNKNDVKTIEELREERDLLVEIKELRSVIDLSEDAREAAEKYLGVLASIDELKPEGNGLFEDEIEAAKRCLSLRAEVQETETPD